MAVGNLKYAVGIVAAADKELIGNHRAACLGEPSDCVVAFGDLQGLCREHCHAIDFVTAVAALQPLVPKCRRALRHEEMNDPGKKKPESRKAKDQPPEPALAPPPIEPASERPLVFTPLILRLHELIGPLLGL